MGIWMLLLQMMLTGESNEPLKCGWEPNAELTPVRQERESAFLDSAQWSLKKPWDGDLVDSEDRITPSGEHPDTDEVMAVAK